MQITARMAKEHIWYAFPRPWY